MTAVKLLLSMAAEKNLTVMFAGGYVCISLREHTEEHVHPTTSSSAEVRRWFDHGEALEAMYGTRAAPQREKVAGLGLNATRLHPSVYRHALRHVLVVVDVDVRPNFSVKKVRFGGQTLELS